MSFTEIRFPENISYGSTGGPEFSTDVVTTHNLSYGLADKERHRNRRLFGLHGVGNQNRKNMN